MNASFTHNARHSNSAERIATSRRRLREREQSPWGRLADEGYTDAHIYVFPWGGYSGRKGTGVKYFPGIGHVSNHYIPSLDDFLAQPYSWESYIASRASHNNSTPYPQGKKPELYPLRKDQEEDVQSIVSAYRQGAPQFLVGNGTGTGKTVTTIAALHRLPVTSLLIVCPSAVIPVWRRHVEHMGDKGIKIVIINYESLKKMVKPPKSAMKAKKISTKNRKISLEGSPYAVFDMVVVDEAHKIKNPTAQQSRIVDMFLSSARFSLLLTATPGKDPSQLGYLWRLLSFNTGDDVTTSINRDVSHYVAWCKNNGVYGVSSSHGKSLTFSGGRRDIEEMEKRIYSPRPGKPVTAIKRQPGDWLPTPRTPYPISLSKTKKKEYDMEVEAVKSILMGGAAHATGKEKCQGIAAMVKLRQKTGMLKAQAIVDYAAYTVNDEGNQVVISTIFHNTSEVISHLLSEKGIDHVVITGKDNGKEKEKKRLSFQKGEVDVVVTSITTGISLHQNELSVGGSDTPRKMIIGDVHFSPVEQVQLEGRINRNGYNGEIIFPVLKNTIDEKVISTLIEGLSTQSILQSTGDVDELEFFSQTLFS